MSEIEQWLDRIGLSQHAALFEENDIDLDVLPELTEQDLKDLGLSLGHRKKLLKAIAETKAGTSRPEAGSEVVRDQPAAPAVTRQESEPSLTERVFGSQSAIEGERKQVTILFADVFNSTGLVEQLDAEQASDVLVPALNHMMEAVRQFQGTVIKVQGDGIMAVFGAPIAHEDHAICACHAAMGMQEAIRASSEKQAARLPPVQIRVGLHSGEVVMRAISNELTSSYDALGMTAHLAARMEKLAKADSVYLTGDTLKLAAGDILTEPLGPHPVKGVSDPVEVFELKAVKTDVSGRLSKAQARGLTPLIGRDGELDLLRDRFDRAAKGQGQIVFLVGEPGIGKSRLLYEFREHIGEDATWLEGNTLSFGQSMAFYPLINLLRRNFKIDENDNEQAIRDKVEHGVLDLDQTLQPIIPYLYHLMGIDPQDDAVNAMDPKRRQAESFAALRQLLLRTSEAKPQVLVFEDLHWIDRASEEFLTFIADSIPSTRVLCLFTYRPGYQQPFGDRTYHSRITLSALSTQDTSLMARAVLAAEKVPEELQQLISQKADGNPFYVEEVIKSLQENGAIRNEGDGYVLTGPPDQNLIPDTLHDVIMARIDRLHEAPKRILQLASVIGREFTRRVLDRLPVVPGPAETHLGELKSTELIYEKSAFPELIYKFKHALTQDAAYHSLLKETRRQYHRLIADVLEEQFKDTVDTQPELVAHHFTEGDCIEKAVTYWQRAGQNAARIMANQEAISHAQQGLQLIERLPGNAERDQTELDFQLMLAPAVAVTKGATALEVERAYTRARELCGNLGNTAQLFPVLYGLCRYNTHRGFLPVARDLGNELLQLAKQEEDTDQLLGAHQSLGTALFYLGEFELADSHFEQGITNLEKSQLKDIRYEQNLSAFALSFASWNLWYLGRLDRAVERSEQALAITQEKEVGGSQAMAAYFAARLRQMRRETAETKDLAARAMALSSLHGTVQWAALSTLMHGWSCFQLGQRDEGIVEMRQGVAGLRTMKFDLVLPSLVLVLVEALSDIGQVDEGLDLLAEAREGMVEGHYYCEAEIYRLRGDLLLQKDAAHAEEAAACFQHAITVSRRQEAKMLELRVATSLGRLWQGQGKLSDAHGVLAPIYEWFTEGLDVADLKDAKALLDSLKVEA